MREGIGEKIGIFTYLTTTFIFSIIISMFYGWKLTLVALSSTPFIIISTAVVARVSSNIFNYSNTRKINHGKYRCKAI